MTGSESVSAEVCTGLLVTGSESVSAEVHGLLVTGSEMVSRGAALFGPVGI